MVVWAGQASGQAVLGCMCLQPQSGHACSEHSCGYLCLLSVEQEHVVSLSCISCTGMNSQFYCKRRF